MATTIKNSGGNRALVCYLQNDGSVLVERFDNEIQNTIGGIVVGSGTDERIFGVQKTVNIVLSSGAWARSLKIGNCSGDLIVGVYFYTAPPAPEPDPNADPDVEPEPPSITSLVCTALQEAFPDGKIGASSFVVSPEQIDFKLEVE